MTYWFNSPGLRNLAPLGNTTGMKGLSSSFLVPKLFVGVNSIPERGGGVLRYVSPYCSQKRAFVVSDKHVMNLATRVSTSLQNTEFSTTIWGHTEPEVPLENVEACAEAMREYEPDLIVAVGGGSVMDLAKAAWILYERPDITDLKTLTPTTPLGLRKKALLLAVPTTSGTGSECTNAAVLSDPDEHRKVPIANRELVPDFAALDPNFTIGMPPGLTAGTGLDVLAHAMDDVLSPASNDITDALALRAIELVFKYLPKAYKNPRDREARLRMIMASSIAGMAFGNASAGLTHSLGHAIGKIFNIHHGLIVGVFIPYIIQFDAFVTDKYLDICKALEINSCSNEEKLKALVNRVRELFGKLDVPLNLKDLGITRQQLDDNMDKLVVDAIEDPDTFGSPRWITEEQCKNLYLYAFDGKDIDF